MTDVSPCPLAEHWEGQCNRYVNGFCSTTRCLVRGGYSGEGPIGDVTPTCEEHETALILRAPSTDTEDGAALRSAISKDEPATASTLRFLRERYQQRKCDSEAVADCTRCQVMFLVRRFEDIRAAALKPGDA